MSHPVAVPRRFDRIADKPTHRGAIATAQAPEPSYQHRHRLGGAGRSGLRAGSCSDWRPARRAPMRSSTRPQGASGSGPWITTPGRRSRANPHAHNRLGATFARNTVAAGHTHLHHRCRATLAAQSPIRLRCECCHRIERSGDSDRHPASPTWIAQLHVVPVRQPRRPSAVVTLAPPTPRSGVDRATRPSTRSTAGTMTATPRSVATIPSAWSQAVTRDGDPAVLRLCGQRSVAVLRAVAGRRLGMVCRSPRTASADPPFRRLATYVRASGPHDVERVSAQSQVQSRPKSSALMVVACPCERAAPASGQVVRSALRASRIVVTRCRGRCGMTGRACCG